METNKLTDFEVAEMLDNAEQPEYVIVTTVASFRHSYAIPVSELQKLNPDVPVQPNEWAKDAVVMQEVEEMSQEYLGEQIIGSRVVNLSELLQIFDSENYYLKSWTPAQKVNRLNNWKART